MIPALLLSLALGQTQLIDQNGNAGTIKAASTPATAADQSIVVSISPNNSINVTFDGGFVSILGNATVVQPTGTNLHAVLDTTSTTACTQATGTNLHVVTDATSVLAANQSVNMSQVGGTNTVTGGVAGLLAVGGNVANAVAATSNPVPVGGIFTTVPTTLTTGQTATAQFTAAQNLKHDLTTIAGTAPSTGTGASGAGIMRVTVSNDSSLAANQSVNTAQFGGTNVSTGTGASGAGIPRVTISNDSSLAANQSVNVAQVGGTNVVTGGVAGIIAVGGNVANAVAATSNPVPVGGIFTTVPATLTTGQTATMQFTAAQNLKHDLTTVGGTAVSTGTGAGGAGIPRVTISNDSSLAANQSVNVAQINGVTPLMGTGATGTGSQRVTLATNSPSFSTSGGTIAADSALQASRAVAYASSPTAIAATTQAPAISDLEGRRYVNIGHPRAINCFVSTTATTSTQITGCEVVASNSIYITSVSICGDIANATATAFTLQSGTSTACTGPHILWAGYHPALSCAQMTFNPPIKAVVAEGLCILDGVTGTKKATVVGYVAP